MPKQLHLVRPLLLILAVALALFELGVDSISFNRRAEYYRLFFSTDGTTPRAPTAAELEHATTLVEKSVGSIVPDEGGGGGDVVVGTKRHGRAEDGQLTMAFLDWAIAAARAVRPRVLPAVPQVLAVADQPLQLLQDFGPHAAGPSITLGSDAPGA